MSAGVSPRSGGPQRRTAEWAGRARGCGWVLGRPTHTEASRAVDDGQWALCSFVSPTAPARSAPLVCVRLLPATSRRRHRWVRAGPDGDPAVQRDERSWGSDGGPNPWFRWLTRVGTQTSNPALIRMDESLNAFFESFQAFLALSSMRSHFRNDRRGFPFKIRG